MRPLAQVAHQRLRVDIAALFSRMRHLPIVETRLWPDEAACESFARELARCPGLMDASIELHGSLGAGKTSLVRHLLRALGVTGRIKSPSYAVLESYSLRDWGGEG